MKYPPLFPTLVVPVPPVGDLRRCDRCGAAGKVQVVLLSGLDLVLCGHHGTEHGPELVDKIVAMAGLD